MCRHAHVTWPQTHQGRTIVSCLDCAREIPYSARYLRPLTRREARFAELRKQVRERKAS